MFGIQKPKRNQTINFLIIILVWLIAIYLWDFLQFTDLRISNELIQDPIAEKMKGLNLLIGGVFLGTIFGLQNLYFKKRQNKLRKQSYGRIILKYSIGHILLTTISIFSIGIITKLIINGTIDKNTFIEIRAYARSANFIRIVLFTYLVSVGITLFQIINQKFGPGVLMDLLLGKYRQPKEENMIFLFMDLKSSTSYAERLGHIKYSELIQDCFSDMTPAINMCEAEIYQYVGDEVVLMWPYKKGVQNGNCINLLFQFKEILQKRSEHYLSNYDFVPQFKAGINGGKLTVAEVGVIKRSVAYHGDVINTASRIQCLCNSFDQEILISENIVKIFGNNKLFNFQFIDNIQLRGKKEKINIFGINNATIKK